MIIYFEFLHRLKLEKFEYLKIFRKSNGIIILYLKNIIENTNMETFMTVFIKLELLNSRIPGCFLLCFNIFPMEC